MDKHTFLFKSSTILKCILENPFLFIPQKCLSGHLKKICPVYIKTPSFIFEPCVLSSTPSRLLILGCKSLMMLRLERWEIKSTNDSFFFIALGFLAPSCQLSLPVWPTLLSISLCVAGADLLALVLCEWQFFEGLADTRHFLGLWSESFDSCSAS